MDLSMWERKKVGFIHCVVKPNFYILHFAGCMYRILRCIFIMPYWFCPLSKRFEALVLSLTLLINMVEHSDENR